MHKEQPVLLQPLELPLSRHANNTRYITSEHRNCWKWHYCKDRYKVHKSFSFRCFLPSLHEHMVSNFLKLSMKQSPTFCEWQEHKATHMTGIAVTGRLHTFYNTFNFFFLTWDLAMAKMHELCFTLYIYPVLVVCGGVSSYNEDLITFVVCTLSLLLTMVLMYLFFCAVCRFYEDCEGILWELFFG
jgi:hypothetical protein